MKLKPVRKKVAKGLRLRAVKKPSPDALRAAQAKMGGEYRFDDQGRTKTASKKAYSEFTRIAREKGYV